MKRIRKPFLLIILLSSASTMYLLHRLNTQLATTLFSSPAVTTDNPNDAIRKKYPLNATELITSNIYNPSSWDDSPIVVEEYKLIFFTQGKVSCTVFKQLFRRMMHLEDWNLDKGAIPHDPRKNSLKYLYHYPPSQAMEMIFGNGGWTKAIFIRDPLERLLSAYLDKGIRKGGAYVIKHCSVPSKQQQLSFAEFIEIIKSSCANDPHWRPQSDRIDQPVLWEYINFVGKFESLHTDTRNLLEKLGAWKTHGASGWGPSGNESIFSKGTEARHKTGSSDLLRMYYNESNIQSMALDFYRKDYAHPLFHFRRPE